ncbi:MAG: flagellin [Amphiplicatus sp.]
MATNGVPDILSHARMSRVVSGVKAEADRTRTEAVTGRYEDATKAVKGDIGGAHLLKKAIEDAQSYQRNLSVADHRAQITQNVLGMLTTESSRIAASAYGALGMGDDAALATLADEARGALYTIFGALNTTDGGRALFAGDEPGATPLGSVETLLADVEAIISGAADANAAETALDAYFNDPAGGFATAIYRGGANDAPAVEIAPGVRINASVKADNQAIKDVIRGFAVLANFAASPGGSTAERDNIAARAAERTLTAEKNVVALRADLGVSESRIAAAKDRHAAEEDVLTSLYNQKVARDPYEAASALQLLESQLEAAYLVTSRLARLTIADYLR